MEYEQLRLGTETEEISDRHSEGITALLPNHGEIAYQPSGVVVEHSLLGQPG